MYLRKILEPETRPEIFIPGYGIGNAAGGPALQKVWVRPPQTRLASNGSDGGTKKTATAEAGKTELPRRREASYPKGIVERKDPFDMATRHEKFDETLYEVIRPLDRPALEQRVSETKGRLEELEKARQEVNMITKPTFLDIGLNPFGRSSAAPSKEMEHRAKWLDTQIEQAERDLIVYNGRLDNMIMMEDMAEFSSWTKEEQDAARAHLQWRAGAFYAGGVPTLLFETEEEKKARDISGLYERYGEDRLEEILESVERDQNARTLREYQDSFDEAAEKGGYWNFLPSVAATAGSGFSNIAGITYSRIHDTGRYSTSDPNHLGQVLSMYSHTVTEHNSKNFGKDLLSFLEFASTSGNAGVYGMTVPTSFQPQMYDGLKGTKAQKAVDTIGGLMYTGGKAAADDLVRKGVGALVGGPGGKAITLGLAGIGCFGDSYNAATRKGATPAEATLLAVTDAGVEVITECMPLEDWWDTVKSNKTLASGLAMDIFKQCGIEIAEEELNLIVSASTEYAVLGERSEYSRRRNELMQQGHTREQAERAVFHAFIEDAMKTAVVTTVSTGLSVGGGRTYGSVTGAYGNTDTRTQRSNGGIATDTASRLPTYQDMNARLEDIRSRQAQPQATQTSETAAASSKGHGPDGRPEMVLRETSDPDTADVPYFTTDHWTGELEGLWTETDARTNLDRQTDREKQTEPEQQRTPVRYEDALRQYLNGREKTTSAPDTALSANTDTALTAKPDAALIADRNTAPAISQSPSTAPNTTEETTSKPKAQVIAELAPKIQKPGTTPGRATIAAEQTYADAEKRFGSDAATVLGYLQPGQDPRRFLDGFQNAYFAGKMGSNEALKNSAAATYLTEEQRHIAYDMGHQAANTGHRAILDIETSDGTMDSNEFWIGRSLGAKAKNYKVRDLATGEEFTFVEGTRLQDVEVFAGKRSKTPYRNAFEYADEYGGKIDDWQHVKGKAWLETPEGERLAEVHWSQCPGIGKVDFFVKKWLD